MTVVDRCLLGDVRRQVIGTLSKGYPATGRAWPAR